MIDENPAFILTEDMFEVWQTERINKMYENIINKIYQTNPIKRYIFDKTILYDYDYYGTDFIKIEKKYEDSFLFKISLTKDSELYIYNTHVCNWFYRKYLLLAYDVQKINDELFMYVDISEEIQRCIANTAIFREELMMCTWHPKRVARLLRDYDWSDEA